MTATLSPEERELFGKQIQCLEEVLRDTLYFYQKNLVLFNGRTTQNYTHYFLQILARFRFNCEGLLNLMHPFHNDYRLKICTNLLLRSICADSLTALYLLTFYSKNDKEHVSIKNELDLISSEYFLAAEQITKEEHNFMNQKGKEDGQILEEKLGRLYAEFSHLIGDNGKIKTRGQIRSTTLPEIKEGLKPNGKLLTENEKFQRIKGMGMGEYGFLFLAFKYYSQFQHFNLVSKRLIEEKPFHDTFYMAWTLDCMVMVTDMLLQMTKSPNPDFREELSSIRSKISNFP